MTRIVLQTSGMNPSVESVQSVVKNSLLERISKPVRKVDKMVSLSWFSIWAEWTKRGFETRSRHSFV